MATAYTEIYKRFYDKISDYDLLDYNLDVREDMLERYLKAAQIEFEYVCKTDLTDNDDLLKQYNADLTEKEMEILAVGMLYNWYNPVIHNTDLTRTFLNTKDFNIHSSANLLTSLQESQKMIEYKYKKLIMDYSYHNADIANLANNT